MFNTMIKAAFESFCFW